MNSSFDFKDGAKNKENAENIAPDSVEFNSRGYFSKKSRPRSYSIATCLSNELAVCVKYFFKLYIINQ